MQPLTYILLQVLISTPALAQYIEYIDLLFLLLEVPKYQSFGFLLNKAKDLASLGEIKARLMASKKLNSLNYSIDVVNNIAYISGIASSEEEISIVTQIAQEAKFIKEVQNFVKVNKDKR